ncbi:hypothetical protein HU200_038855 [Digitaria exilis]|uniref:DUF4220 domain-containing protein n=1 Tax=Digitaria exilis TaxID=1010633 RepID=A0A835BCX7_9POAL|nr:hypothetical protein HU200_038855 [Digitaria exilis]
MAPNYCPDVVVDEIRKLVIKNVWQVNGLMLFNVIIMGIVVFISICAPRYRRHPIIGFIFKGANILFLPMIPIVAAYAVIDTYGLPEEMYIMTHKVKVSRIAGLHNFLVVLDGSRDAKQVIGPPHLIVREGGPMTLEEEPHGYSYGFGMQPAVLIYEIKELLSHLCSNFTKVVLICNYVHRTRCPKLVSFVSKHLRCKWLLDPWDDKMNQCKILVFHPWQVSVLVRHLFRMPNQKKVKVPSEVKKSIIDALKRLESEHQEQALEVCHAMQFSCSILLFTFGYHCPISSSSTSTATGAQSACDGRADAQSACGGRGVADTILAWHIATSILEVKDPQPTDHPGCKTAAIRLSQYCAYLVCYHPELLPDDVEWCKTLQEAVRKDATLAISGLHRRGAKLERVVELIEANSKHDVVREGARLAKELDKRGTGWDALATFWSEMILYVAPSEKLEKLDAHAEAIARGGELVTLVWTMLAHAGIVARLKPRNTAARDVGDV